MEVLQRQVRNQVLVFLQPLLLAQTGVLLCGKVLLLFFSCLVGGRPLPVDREDGPVFCGEVEDWPGYQPEEGEVEDPADPGNAGAVDPVWGVDVYISIADGKGYVNVSAIVGVAEAGFEVLFDDLFLEAGDFSLEAEDFEPAFAGAEVPTPLAQVWRSFVADLYVLIVALHSCFTEASSVCLLAVADDVVLYPSLPSLMLIAMVRQEFLQTHHDVEVTRALLAFLVVLLDCLPVPSFNSNVRSWRDISQVQRNVIKQLLLRHEIRIHAYAGLASNRGGRVAVVLVEGLPVRLLGCWDGAVRIFRLVSGVAGSFLVGRDAVTVGRKIGKVVILVVAAGGVHRYRIGVIAVAAVAALLVLGGKRSGGMLVVSHVVCDISGSNVGGENNEKSEEERGKTGEKDAAEVFLL